MAEKIPAGTIVTWGYTKFGVVMVDGTMLFPVSIEGPMKYKCQRIDTPSNAEKVHDFELESIPPEVQMVFDAILKTMGKTSPFPVNKAQAIRMPRTG